MKKILNKKIIFVMLPILLLLIAALIAIGITNAANNATEPETKQTFTEEGDGYYIWVRAVDHAGNKGPWSEAQRVWIDASGPSAPVITGGSNEYALSRTISVVTESDDNGASGVAYYEYYQKSGADKPATNIEGTKVTTSATSQEFNTNIAGEYVFFRAVDVVGNKGAWSDGQQVCIDINSPTVTANNESITIDKGTSKTFESLFTVSNNGNAAISSTVYTLNNASTSYMNTSSLEVGTYTLTCTVTKVGGKTDNASVTIIVNNPLPTTETQLAYCYGDRNVNFTVPVGVNVIKIKFDYERRKSIYNTEESKNEKNL